MTKERWQLVERIYHAALERDGGARDAFLAQECAGDDDLHREVEKLIGQDDLAGSFIESPAIDVAARILAEDSVCEIEGRLLGSYKVLSRLGTGGMGVVYLGEDTSLERKVAIKFLSPELTDDEHARKRLIREAHAAASLDHPNICAIYEIREQEGESFIVMQYVEGETLADRMKNKPLELRESLDIGVQIADALAEAHSRGIIHRDIKPQNIMITPRGQAKLMDFGIARVIRKDSLIARTETESAISEQGVAIGTAPYMSPEQVRAEELDARSDIFSFGVMFYEMLSGTQPFKAACRAETMAAILTKDPAPLERRGSEIPDELQRIVRKAISKDKERRYQGINDLLIDLRDLKQDMELEARRERSTGEDAGDGASATRAASSGPAETPNRPLYTVRSDEIPEKWGREGNRTRRSWVVVALLLSLLIAVAAYFTYRPATSNPSKQFESIAVLPFQNEGGNPEVEHLSDGMTESLIDSLSQIPGLSVKSRSSVFQYKGKEVDPQQVASTLSVQAVLIARLVKRGDDLTLFLSLIDGRNGNHIWGDKYDRNLTDLVALQSQITRDVSQKLRARLSRTDELKVAKNYTANTEAYQLYLKGRHHARKETRLEIRKAILYFQQAIALDPSYALAHMGIATAYWSLSLAGEMPSSEVLPMAKAAAQEAIAIDDTLAGAHAILGSITFWYEWDWKEAESQFKRALELDPSSEGTHSGYAHFLSNLGRHPEALAEIKRAIELEPTELVNNAFEGYFLLQAGRPDEALAKLQKTVELDPNHWLPHSYASIVYIEKGMFVEAVAEARKARETSGANTWPIAWGAYALAKSGQRLEARAELKGLVRLSRERYVSPYKIAMIYNGLDECDEALTWLEMGCDQRHTLMTFLKVEPKWNKFRDDPRFQHLMQRVGLPDDPPDRAHGS